jgi:hypothetical protein
MTFTQPFFLLLLIALPYFAYLGWPVGRYGRGRAWAAMGLRCLIALLIVFSLAGAQSVHGGDELAVVFLVDVSDSVPEPERERALAFVEKALATMGPDDRAALVLFGADALVERPMMGGGELGEIASIPRTHQTDLEGVLRLGMALFPAGSAHRLIILSDGRPTLGEAGRAVQLAHAQGAQVDVVPLDATLQDEAWLSKLAVPDRLHQGEEFTLSVTAHATAGMEAVLTILAGDNVVAQEQVHLNPGPNTFAIPLTASEPGFTSFRAYLTPATTIRSLPSRWLRDRRVSSSLPPTPPKATIYARRCNLPGWTCVRLPPAHWPPIRRAWPNTPPSCWWTRRPNRSLHGRWPRSSPTCATWAADW